ncbi:transglutaminase domain-containing protein [Paractinoplanes lichenicola]|uniref:Transglutaminase domain-containing protein n=1 Tax=Paractinoplanes lichenicola TaxID=2802976 RepID=A0ABS1VTV8_9ACTN|nr:transglutaminase domain-containing protein [Actinoplanes lichenicola]MBL7257898.1 transglutaminase domain-containing protein [Actinoplanes lichenicola]
MSASTLDVMMTDLGRHTAAVKDLPADLATIVRTVQGLLLHEGWAASYGVELDDPATVHLRRAEELLDAAGDRPLSEAREPGDRVPTMCRSFTVLTVAMLRAHGFDARSRAGFGAYFTPGRYDDHWVVEVGGRLVDAQLDALQAEALKLGFDPLDVPRDQFLPGPDAWRLVRDGKADPELFGHPPANMAGEWFIAGNVIRDRADVEALPWDSWDPMPGPGDPVDRDLIDRIAAGDEAVKVPGEVFNVRRGRREPLASA